MRIVIDHLTRMTGAHICVAGFDETARRYVRPLPFGERLSVDDLAARRGCFDLGSIVELGRCEPTPSRPESEDWRIARRAARSVVQMAPEVFWAGLVKRAQPTFTSIFGPDLVQDDAILTMGKLRLPLTDLRCFHDAKPENDVAQQLSTRVAMSAVLLSVGLGRAWQPPGRPAVRNWLQVNNVHLPDEPLWGTPVRG